MTREESAKHSQALNEFAADFSKEHNTERWDAMKQDMRDLRELLVKEELIHGKFNDHQSRFECKDAVDALDAALEKLDVVCGS